LRREAPLIAAKEPVRGLIVINTVGRPLFEYLLDTRRRQMQLAHQAYDQTDRLMALDERCNHRLLIDKEPPATIIAALPACADFITYPAPFTFMQQWPTSTSRGVEGDRSAGAHRLRHIRLCGDRGRHPYLADVINAFHPGTATLRPISGMDHPMNKAASMAESFDRKGPAIRTGSARCRSRSFHRRWLRGYCGYTTSLWYICSVDNFRSMTRLRNRATSSDTALADRQRKIIPELLAEGRSQAVIRIEHCRFELAGTFLSNFPPSTQPCSLDDPFR